MRYGLMSLVILAFVVATSEPQDTKKKDADKKKEAGKEKEPPKAGSFVEPTEIMGRTFKEWRGDIKDKDPSKREAAMRNVLMFGPERAYDAVPDILAELKKHTTSPVDLSVRVNGVMALNTIFKYKKDPDPKLAKDVIGIYRTFLTDSQLLLKIRILQGLFYYGPAARDALPEVYKLAATKDSLTWEARKEAVQILGIVGFSDQGTPSVAVMQEVLKSLNDSSYQVRLAALNSIARLGSTGTAEQKIPILSRLNSVINEDPDPQVQITAHMSVMTLEKKVTPKHLNPIIKLSRHKDPAVRLLAIQSFAVTGKDGLPAVPTLLEAIHDPDVSIGVTAINSLLSLEADAELIPVLRKIKNDKNAHPLLHNAAEEGLEFIAEREKMRKEKKDKDKKDKK